MQPCLFVQRICHFAAHTSSPPHRIKLHLLRQRLPVQGVPLAVQPQYVARPAGPSRSRILFRLRRLLCRRRLPNRCEERGGYSGGRGRLGAAVVPVVQVRLLQRRPQLLVVGRQPRGGRVQAKLKALDCRSFL